MSERTESRFGHNHEELAAIAKLLESLNGFFDLDSGPDRSVAIPIYWSSEHMGTVYFCGVGGSWLYAPTAVQDKSEKDKTSESE